MRIGISIVGMMHDQSSLRERRWGQFRPSVAFGTQRELPLDRLLLLYQPEAHSAQNELSQEELCQLIARDIQNIGELSIDQRPVKFDDPFDFRGCYRVLSELVCGIETKKDDEIVLLVNNGTHIMQFAMFVMVDKQITEVPLKLVQAAPGTGESPDINTVKSKAKLLDLPALVWEGILEAFKAKSQDTQEVFSYVPTNHAGFRSMLRDLVLIAKDTDEPVVLLGETGTGKTRIAEAIHAEWSKRKNMIAPPFVEVNCAAISTDSNSAQSALFGHVRGAFTGSLNKRDGYMKLADRGTLFLDEVAELDQRTQAILLNAIERKEFYPLGSDTTVKSAFRLICATNKNLHVEVAEKRFRADLYARIRPHVYGLPALRDRACDIEGNVVRELEKWNASAENRTRARVRFEKHAFGVYLHFAKSPEARWTGNFRDLCQSVHRMAIRASASRAGEQAAITDAIVANEIGKLKELWTEPALSASGIGDEEFLLRIENLVRDRYPNLTVADGIEKFALETMYGLTGKASDTAKRLYESPSRKLSNASDRFAKRKEYFDREAARKPKIAGGGEPED